MQTGTPEGKRRILITGASPGGFGNSIYTHLKQRGHFVFGIGLGGPDLDVDFRKINPLELQGFFYDVANKYGPFDVLINNAGTIDLAFLEKIVPDKLGDTIYVNLTVPILLCSAFVKWNHEEDGPALDDYRIINTTSMCAVGAGRACSGYNASKAGLESFTRGLARELAKTPVIACCVAPSIVENTRMQEVGIAHLIDRGMTVGEAHKYQTANPMGRRIQHEELCKVYQFAVEEMPAAMSGTILRIPLASGN